MKLTAEQATKIRENMWKVPDEDKRELIALLEEYEYRQEIKAAQDDFLTFILRINKEYKVGAHHKYLARLLQEVVEDKKDRIAVSVAPRFGKSLMLSEYYPAWFMGRFPAKKLIIASHTADLAVDFGRKVRNLIASDVFKEVFPDVALSLDAKSAGRWTTNKGGEFFAVGVGGALAGRGADLLVIDDPYSEQDILSGNTEVFTKTYDWYAYGARTRLMPGGKVVIVHTRWAPEDLIGRLAKDQYKDEYSDKWELVPFPAILDEGTDKERSLWPEQWSLEALKRTKASMPLFQWCAQYMQEPTPQEGAIVQKQWFRTWTGEDPPHCEYTILSLDAAQEKSKRADFTAFTYWGIFYLDNEFGERTANIILLDAINKRMDYPELKDTAMRLYKEHKPDTFVIEKKSNGAPLFQELRRTGLPVIDFVPTKGNDKLARLNAVSDIIRSGLVWVPPLRFAEEVVEQINAFPATQHDDLVDSTTMALLRFRNGGFIKLQTDDDMDEEREFVPIQANYYQM